MNQQLEEHRQTVEELQLQREGDEAQILQRSNEVIELRSEVERLAVEVRRLRTIIEGKLRERRPSGSRQSVRQHVEQPEVHSEEEDIETQLDETHPFPEGEEEESANEEEPIRWDQPASGGLHVSPERKQKERLSTVSEVDEPPSHESMVASERPASRLHLHEQVRQPLPAPEESEEEIDHDFRTRATIGSSGRAPRRFINVSLSPSF